MRLTGEAYWTPEVNHCEVECDCGNKFFARVDRVKVQCPKCKHRGDIHELREEPRRVVHCKKSVFDVFAGRPSKWGNPFSHLPNSRAEFLVATREEAIRKHREWIMTQDHLLNALPELIGKVLGCYCAPKPCHADTLVELSERARILLG